MKRILFIFIFLGFFTEAGLHIEPYAGYSFMWSRPIDITTIKNRIRDLADEENQVDQVISGVENLQKGLDYIQSTTIYRGYSGGLRVGYKNFGLALGVDVSGDYLQRFSGSSASAHSITSFLPGIFASYKLPFLFRAYGVLIPNTYGLSLMQIHKADEDPINCISSGLKVGISYLSLPFLSVNFEYQGLASTTPTTECRKAYHKVTAFLNVNI